PPGYMSPESLKRALAAKRGHKGGVKIEQLIERGIMICGSPATVRRRITECHHRMAFQELVCMLQFGTLPARLTEKNIRLFAWEVMPAVTTLTHTGYRGFALPPLASRRRPRGYARRDPSGRSAGKPRAWEERDGVSALDDRRCPEPRGLLRPGRR